MATINRKRRRRNVFLGRPGRLGAAAVEAAVCLPVLVIVWLGASELNQYVSLRQQTQIMASLTADKVVRSLSSFEFIEGEVKKVAQSLGLNDVEIKILQVDDEVVESTVTVDFAGNSATKGLLRINKVSSVCYSYRKEEG